MNNPEASLEEFLRIKKFLKIDYPRRKPRGILTIKNKSIAGRNLQFLSVFFAFGMPRLQICVSFKEVWVEEKIQIQIFDHFSLSSDYIVCYYLER